MYLEELLEVINQNTVIHIWNNNNNLIAIYDGRESIPKKYNYREVLDVFSYITNRASCIGIEIRTEL